MLTGERTVVNFLQTLASTATTAHEYAQLVKAQTSKSSTPKKNNSGLTHSQKYAVLCGGCYNHRIGLYDAFLIKENHITACGGITNAVTKARELHPGKPVEVEVENFEELKQALHAKADIIMLDNFSIDDAKEAVQLVNQDAKIEISGNISAKSIETLIAVRPDFVSSGGVDEAC